MEKYYVVDTNVLLDDPEIISQYKVVILADVLRELEKHKKSYNKELAYNARKATRFIEDNSDKILVDLNDYEVKDDRLDKDYVDNRIIFACKNNNYGLITNDLLLKFKAKGFGIELIEVKEKDEIDYKGYKFVDLTEEEMAYFYENMDTNIYNLYINQYLIIRDKYKNTIDKYRWTGETHKKLHLPPKKIIKAQNDLQECALDLLHDTSIPIKFVVGTYGSGKTLLSTKMAVYHVLEKGNYAKIMAVRNPIGTGEAIGFLKGDKDQKTEGFFKPIIQHLEGGEQEADYLEQRGQLIREIPYYMKGLSIDEAFIIVDEAEDLDVKLIKTIGTRLEKNSAIVFSGDFNQSEEKYKHNNGLIHAINKLKNNPLVGIIVLDKDVRSDASKVFSEL